MNPHSSVFPRCFCRHFQDSHPRFAMHSSKCIRFRRESSLLCVTLFRALFSYLFAFFRHSETASSTEFFLFRLVATRSPTGLLPGPTVDSDAPMFPLHAVAFANTSAHAARFPGSEKRNADECSWRLDWVEDLHQFQNGSARKGSLSDTKWEGESVVAAKAFLICCISIDRSYAVKKCVPWDKQDTKFE